MFRRRNSFLGSMRCRKSTKRFSWHLRSLPLCVGRTAAMLKSTYCNTRIPGFRRQIQRIRQSDYECTEKRSQTCPTGLLESRVLVSIQSRHCALYGCNKENVTIYCCGTENLNAASFLEGLLHFLQGPLTTAHIIVKTCLLKFRCMHAKMDIKRWRITRIYHPFIIRGNPHQCRKRKPQLFTTVPPSVFICTIAPLAIQGTAVSLT